MAKKIAKYPLKNWSKDRYIDDRGIIKQINDESEFAIKRIYLIKPLKGVVRAFHGHKKEYKAFYVLRGLVKFVVVNMENDEVYVIETLSDNKTLYVPPGFYNGFVALTDNAEVLGFSSFTVKESENDDFRKPFDYIGKDIWESRSR